MILLDTDIAVDVLRKHPRALDWFVSTALDDAIFLPGLVAMELIDGAATRTALNDVQRFIEQTEIFWLEPEAARRGLNTFVQVHLRNAIGFADVLIAQTAIELNLPLHTFNTKHYAAIPDLQTVQPYAR